MSLDRPVNPLPGQISASKGDEVHGQGVLSQPTVFWYGGCNLDAAYPASCARLAMFMQLMVRADVNERKLADQDE